MELRKEFHGGPGSRRLMWLLTAWCALALVRLESGEARLGSARAFVGADGETSRAYETSHGAAARAAAQPVLCCHTYYSPLARIRCGTLENLAARAP